MADNILWTSPADSLEGWMIPELEEAYWVGRIWELELANEARIAKVDSLDDMEALAKRYPGGRNLDWTALSKDYDAFWVTADGLADTCSTSQPLNLSEFVCETVVVFNTSLVKVIGVRDDLP